MLRVQIAILALGLLMGPVTGFGQSAPTIAPSALFRSQAVEIGETAFFAVTALGTAPFFYQWQLDGQAVPGQTNRTLKITAVQATNEGTYSVIVSNAWGATNSYAARLWVVPPVTNMHPASFTNRASVRLPYFYSVPPGYDPSRSYPLICDFAALQVDWPTYAGADPATRVIASYKEQTSDPAILLWFAEDFHPDVNAVAELVQSLTSQFNLDTNRLYLKAGGQGTVSTWDLVRAHPGLFAAAIVDGTKDSTADAAIQQLPFWSYAGVNTADAAVFQLRKAGAHPIYTTYAASVSLFDALDAGVCTPEIIGWLLAQRRGIKPMSEPLLSITNWSQAGANATGTPTLDLAGTAAALRQAITQVSWTNLANKATGKVPGSNTWSFSGIPLKLGQTNVIIVTATTTSWSPPHGGSTTFSDTVAVFPAPLQAALQIQGGSLQLNWTGGTPPFRVQRATDLGLGNWGDVVSNAVPPVTLTPEHGIEFYRVVGH